MEYIEYFFGNFWHFLELFILVVALRGICWKFDVHNDKKGE